MGDLSWSGKEISGRGARNEESLLKNSCVKRLASFNRRLASRISGVRGVSGVPAQSN